MKLGIKNFLIAVVFLMLSACASTKSVTLPVPLASFTESDVAVSIWLDGSNEDGFILSAVFTPLESYHLYSKDIPITGVDGLGRPTLLELTTDSQMKSTGGLIENVSAEFPDFEPKGLLVYPAGAVTLSLPVELPPGYEWVEDTVSITYMACSDHGCKAPVVAKLVTILVPGSGFSIMGDGNE